MSEISLLRTFSAQVSKLVFLAYFTIVTVYYNCMTWNGQINEELDFSDTSITEMVEFWVYLTILRSLQL